MKKYQIFYIKINILSNYILFFLKYKTLNKVLNFNIFGDFKEFWLSSIKKLTKIIILFIDLLFLYF
jgi:hypothetical protein